MPSSVLILILDTSESISYIYKEIVSREWISKLFNKNEKSRIKFCLSSRIPPADGFVVVTSLWDFWFPFVHNVKWYDRIYSVLCLLWRHNDEWCLYIERRINILSIYQSWAIGTWDQYSGTTGSEKFIPATKIPTFLKKYRLLDTESDPTDFRYRLPVSVFLKFILHFLNFYFFFLVLSIYLL